MSDSPHTEQRPHTGEARGCYCDLWQTNPTMLESQGIPPDYCGRSGWSSSIPVGTPAGDSTLLLLLVVAINLVRHLA